MKQYILILGLIWESEPLSENFTTLIREVDNVIESDDIYELEQMGSIYLSEGGYSYKILDRAIEHEGVAWSNKALNQLLDITKIEYIGINQLRHYANEKIPNKSNFLLIQNELYINSICLN